MFVDNDVSIYHMRYVSIVHLHKQIFNLVTTYLITIWRHEIGLWTIHAMFDAFLTPNNYLNQHGLFNNWNILAR